MAIGMNPLGDGDLPEEYIENEDGSVEILEMETISQDPFFTENLANILSDGDLQRMGSEYCDLIEKDAKAREKRDELYEEGLRRTGLGDDAPGGAQFNGASKVVHPLLAEACVEFASRTIKELFPPNGPVKSHILGKRTPQKLERADRKTQFMNWQLTKKVSEFKDELEKLLSQLPMGGSQFQKWTYDDRMGRARCEFVPIDEVLLPFSASSFYTSQRVTHQSMISRQTLHSRIGSGLYRDVFLPDPGFPEQTLSEEANQKIEGLEESGYNEDGLRRIYEVYTWMEIPGDKYSKGELSPYILTIDSDTEKVLGLYRNWAEDDSRREKLDWMVEWKFIPWRGVYAVGLPHLIGSLSGAATGALRALLDSAHINNAASMLKLKSGRVVGQNQEVAITQITEIEGPAGIDDIRKLAMAMPFNPPSPVLVQLLEMLYSLSRGVVSTTNDALQNVGDRTPVGTTMALIEQGAPTYSAIHARLHDSMKKSLEILHRLNGEFLDDEEVVEELGELMVSREDFLGPMDIQPVSDPNIFSEAQRFAQTQSLVQMSADASVPWNKQNIYRRVLKQMRIEDPDEILPELKDPVTSDVFEENSEALEGHPLEAEEEQDHLEHIHGHLAFLMSPLQLQNPLIQPPMLMMMLQHIGEHVNMFQRTLVAQLIPQSQNLAAAEMQGQSQAAQILAPIIQQVAALQQQIQQKMPPPQLPPEIQAQMQIAQMENQRKSAHDQALLTLKQNQQQMDAQLAQLKVSMDQQALAMKMQMDAAQQQFDQFMAQQKQMMDNQSLLLSQQVELQKNREDNKQHQVTEILKNNEDNRTNLTVAMIREKGQTDAQVEKASTDAMLRVLEMDHQNLNNEADRQLQRQMHQANQSKEKENGQAAE